MKIHPIQPIAATVSVCQLAHKPSTDRSTICNMAIGGITLLSATLALCGSAAAATLYQADYKSHSINKIDTLTGIVTPFSTKADGLNGPIGLAFDPQGNLFEADYTSRGHNLRFDRMEAISR